MDLLRRKHNNILLHIVDIGNRKIKIPVAQLGNGEGETVLITAGLDGDEYAGIEAAYRLIDEYAKKKFTGRVIIIPILNIPGFEAAVSWNPLDNKYPKHIFPGKEKGSATERLMYWLSENFVKDVDLWIDLHSGASTEMLDPFVWVWKTSKKHINEKVIESLQKIKAETIICQQVQERFIDNIAQKNTGYILFESGQLGQRNSRDIKQHIDWVRVILEEAKRPIESRKKRMNTIAYRSVDEILAKQEGIWVPLFSGKQVRKGTLLGEVRSLDGKILEKLIAKANGVFLWRREAMFCKKADSLYAYAHMKSSL